MLEKYKTILVTVIVTAVFFVIAIILINSIDRKTPYIQEVFDEQITEFDKCYDGEDSELAKEIYSSKINDYAQEELFEIFSNNFQTSCSTRFVTSNSDQIRDMALFLATHEKRFKFVDAVYTAPQDYYAIIGIPQEYLFYALTEDKKTISAYVVRRSGDGYTYEQLFETSNDEEAQQYLQYLLIIYREVVKL